MPKKTDNILTDFVFMLLEELKIEDNLRYIELSYILDEYTLQVGYLQACKDLFMYLEESHLDLYSRIQRMHFL